MILIASNRYCTVATVSRMIGSSPEPVASAVDVAGCIDRLRSAAVSVVVCDGDLPGGGWKPILETIQTLAAPPLLVVTAPHADWSLWAEVLNLGGYDVLAQPFELDEVRRIILRAAAGPAATRGLRRN